ncbi:isoleucine--tRNA ligase, mitochondrial-like isoform X1 [Corticium candelabrum]|uniref:isoleucine--tRNA ligase, mitochondrial-like isoform X1 n=1 Tax=Corticium candelabrum TaxID=121492 RepID=UPI002E2687A6|nr:isoleucine--tRNA ligase, mitochondrial-like isoform X1 [Corticium candelabrum]
MMQGYRVHYIPGWDCHGLPIEIKALQAIEHEKLSPLAIRNKACRFAEHYIKQQREQFQRWGLLADWSNAYRTMDKPYEANQLRVFLHMYEDGLVYRSVKPVYWSPSSRTALAEAELEYYDKISKSIYVKFCLQSASMPDFLRGDKPVSLLVWTTTPWTIPANKAVCFSNDATYCVVECECPGRERERLIVAVNKLDDVRRALKQELPVLMTFPGHSLRTVCYHHAFQNDIVCPVLSGSHVSMETGTGLVHTAPAHGMEDYVIGKEHGLDLDCAVDDDGLFAESVGFGLAGKNVLDEGNIAVIDHLERCGALLHTSDYVHRYPHDWRTKQPIILRSTPQWFASLTVLKEQAMRSLNNVKMTPTSSVNRMMSMLEGRDDWCISRQRVWGVPIPAFYSSDTGEVLMNRASVSHVISLVEKQGADCWWKLPVADLLSRDVIEQSGSSDFIRGDDTMDIWFDSGTSWASVLKESLDGLDGIADMYLEGSDQHRGWFQSSLLTRVAVHGDAPYKHIVTHGFVLDEQGRKMSKSLGNVISPDDIINGNKHQSGYGADIMRLWSASTDYQTDISLGPGLLSRISEQYRKVRNTARFMLGNLFDFTPSTELLPDSQLLPLDQYVLHLLHLYADEVTKAYEDLVFSKVHHSLMHLVTTDLSAFYFDSIKDRLYVETAKSPVRLSAQTALYHLLSIISKSFAPILPHLAEEIYSHRVGLPDESGSAFKNGWLDCPSSWRRPDLATDFEIGRQIQNLAHNVLEKARIDKAIGSSLEADLIIATPKGRVYDALRRLHGRDGTCGVSALCDIVNTSHVSLVCSEDMVVQPDLHLHDCAAVETGLPENDIYAVSGDIALNDGTVT